MKRKINLVEAKGKTLTASAASSTAGQMVLVFGDLYCCLGINLGWDPGDEEIEEEELELFGFGDDALIAVGILTRDELETRRKARNDERQRQQDALERNQYERLRRRFEG